MKFRVFILVILSLVCFEIQAAPDCSLYLASGSNLAPQTSAVRVAYPSPLKLVPASDPILQNQAQVFDPNNINTPEFKTFISDFKKFARASRGVGLAAPQVGFPYRIVYAQKKYSPWMSLLPLPIKDLILINPKIIARSKAMRLGIEGCLSLASTCDLVSRHKVIRVQFYDENGVFHEQDFNDFTAVILQHEIDHLEGVLFTSISRKSLEAHKIPKAEILEVGDRLSLINFIKALNPEQQKVFLGLNKRFNRDLYLMTQTGSLTEAFFDVTGFDSLTQVFNEVFEFYKIVVTKGYDVEYLKRWVKSEIHALYLLEFLYLSPDPTSKLALSKIRKDNIHFSRLSLTGLDGPPFKNLRRVKIKTKDSEPSFKFNSVRDALDFSEAVKTYTITYANRKFILNVSSPSGGYRVEVKSKEEVIQIYRTQLKLAQRGQALVNQTQNQARAHQRTKVTYGLEAEYVPNVSSKILEDYRTAAYTDQQWRSLPVGQKSKLFEDLIREHGKDAKFIKLKTSPKWLPDFLYGENDGNYEFNGLIYQSLEECKVFIDRLETRYGKPSWQGHVVFPRNTLVQGLAGYSVFEGDLVQLNTLERHYDIFLQNPGFKKMAGNLFHHSLGPMGPMDLVNLTQAERDALRGKDIRLDKTHKVNAPVFRTQPYGDGSIGFEFRQFHNRSQELLAAMSQLSIEIEMGQGLSQFAKFANIKMQSQAVALKVASGLGAPMRSSWLNIFIYKLTHYIKAKNPGTSMGGMHLAGERFLFPLRDWSQHPLVNDLSDIDKKNKIDQINRASLTYATEFKSLVEKSIVDAEVETKLRFLITRWAHEAGLAELFFKYKENFMLNSNDQALDNFFKRYQPLAKPSQRITTLPDLPLILSERSTLETKYYSFSKADDVQALFASADYQLFLQNSVEIIFTPTTFEGHIQLRVGDRIYAFNYIETVLRENFKSVSLKKGKLGFVFFVPAERIRKVQAEINQFYNNSQSYNLVGFDGYSGELALFERFAKGSYQGLKYSSNYVRAANNLPAQGLIVRDGDDVFVETPNGNTYRAFDTERGVCVRGLNCGSSAIFVLKTFLGIELESFLGAVKLKNQFVDQTAATRPDVIIDYAKP